MPKTFDASTWSIRDLCAYLEDVWGTRPFAVLACAGGTDEAWLLFRDPTTGEPDAILL